MKVCCGNDSCEPVFSFPPLEKLNWDSIPRQLPEFQEFRSSCPRLGGEGARNAGAEAWAAPDRVGSEFWECLCSWSPLGEGARAAY